MNQPTMSDILKEIRGLGERIDQFEEKFSSRIDQVEGKIDQVEDKLSSQIDQLESVMSSRFNQLEQAIYELKDDIENNREDNCVFARSIRETQQADLEDAEVVQ